MTQEMQMNTNSARRRHANTIERPMTFEPTSTSFYKPSVEAAVMPGKSEQHLSLGFWTFLIVSVIVGLLSGIVLSGMENVQWQASSMSGYPSGGITAFYIVWGLLLGALFGVILNALYPVVKRGMPLFALLLFVPTVLFLLTSPLLVVTNLLLELLKIVLAIVVIVVVIAIAWAWLAG